MSCWPDIPPTTITTIDNTPAPAKPTTKPSVELQQQEHLEPTTAHNNCPFLDLPTEMRLSIYELALLEAEVGVSSLTLLQACRHISMEARPTLYKRPTSFASQAKLFAWIDSSRKQDLKRVRTLTLRLTDLDLSPILDPSTGPVQKARVGLLASYQRELERFDDALKALPNVSSLTIIPPKAGRSQLLKGLYHSFLALLPRRCPKLKHLELQDVEEILGAVPALKQVRGVKCTGTSPRPTYSRKTSAEGSTKPAEPGDREEIDVEVASTSSSSDASVSSTGKTEKVQARKDSGRVDGIDVDV